MARAKMAAVDCGETCWDNHFVEARWDKALGSAKTCWDKALAVVHFCLDRAPGLLFFVSGGRFG